jgi:glycosyltransferase involved in cell wall biosynthesis
MIIIIPCFNEYTRINKTSYINFLNENKNCTIVFAEDGSTDDTLKVLKEIQDASKNNVHIHVLDRNKGKAEAIREAVLYSYENKLAFNKLAYIDADLSVSLEECLSISDAVTNDVFFAFGSRILKIDSYIKRRKFRHYTGRFIATIISTILKVPVYDTQCGCKIFSRSLANQVFHERFISKWLFDVEIFFRIINLYSIKDLQDKSREIPLKSWIDSANSKVKITYFFKMWYDIYSINRKYNEKYK